jgi:hypothetical protein
VNLTPKKKFQENKQAAEKHRDLVLNPDFRNALEAALLEQILTLPNTFDPTEAAAAYYRIVGARDFITHLLSIAELPKALSGLPPINLDHSR